MKITLDDVVIYTLDYICSQKTIAKGHDADLKLEEYRTAANGRMILVRYWLNRTTPSDGETHRAVVEARECPNGTWEDVGKLYPYFGE